MSRSFVARSLALSSALLLASASSALAWEASTTHAGLAEEAALASALHRRLIEAGFSGGLFEVLAIPPAEAPEVFAALKLHSPSQGTVPDARGRMTAMGWLAAGAVLADTPVELAANHFFDPTTGRGWELPTRSALASLWDKLAPSTPLPARGVPAPDWVVDPKNPLSVDAFFRQYHKALLAGSPAERARHMAAALLAAGAVLHVLGDVGTPSHARADAAAHFEPLSAQQGDVGSRFDRIAALAFGRLGVPAPSRVVTRTSVRAFFTSADGQGLADWVTSRFFSAGTLPADTLLGASRAPAPALARPKPEVSGLALMSASRQEGATLKGEAGVCLARYRVERNLLSFYLDDPCMLEQAQAILPEVAAYQTGLLDFLFRGQLEVRQDGAGLEIAARSAVGAGQLDVMLEDARGQRTSLRSQAVAQGEGELVRLSAPSSGRVIAVFRGKDAAGEPVLSIGRAVVE